MSEEELIAKLDSDDNGEYLREYLRFERVLVKRSKRPDLHAFLLLDELIPGTSDIVRAAEHDEFWLDIDLAQLAERITDEQVVELIRCGVRCSADSLAMFT